MEDNSGQAIIIAIEIIRELYNKYGQSAVDRFFIEEQEYFRNDWDETVGNWSIDVEMEEE